MVEKQDIEFWLAVNDAGDSAVSFEGAEDAIATVVDAYSGAAIRTVRMTVSMALPIAYEAAVDVSGEDDAGRDVETAIKEVEEAAAA
jgi:hypothetical protein